MLSGFCQMQEATSAKFFLLLKFSTFTPVLAGAVQRLAGVSVIW